MNKNNDNILSIDFDDNDSNIDITSFTEYCEKDTERKKNRFVLDIQDNAESLLKEIEWKKTRNKITSVKLISYILKHCNNKYCEDELNSFSFEDIKKIHSEIKLHNKSNFKIFIQFLFNL